MVSDLSETIKSHASGVSVQSVALKGAITNPVLNPVLTGKDRDLLYLCSVGKPTFAELRDLRELADKIGRS